MLNTIVVLAIVLLVGITLRFYRLKQRGLLHFDDGLRMLEVVFLHDLFDFLKNNKAVILAKKKIDIKSVSDNFRGRFLFDTNPLNIFIYFFSSKIINNIEYSALYANAFLGIFGILGTYFTATLMFGNHFIGLFSALFIAVSGYHLVYSRSIHAEITCGTFYIWATYFYILSYKTGALFYLLISGFFIGFAFCCNSRQFYMPLFFIFWEIMAAFKFSFTADLIITRLILLALSMTAPLFLIEEVFVILKEFNYPYPTFFRQLFFRTGNFSLPTLRFPFLKMYLGIIIEYEGVVIPFFLLAGAVFLLKNVSFEAVILLTQFLVPLLFWSGRPDISREQANAIDDGTGGYAYALPRLISSSQYSMAIISAFGLVTLLNLSQDVKLIYILFAAILIIRIIGLLKIIGVKSGYKQAAKFILASNNPKHISFCYPNSEFFTSKENALDVSYIKSEEDFIKLYKEQKVRYVLYSDFLYANLYNSIAVKPLIDKIIIETQPVFSIGMGMGNIKAIYLEEYNSPWVKMFKDDKIKIYDLKNYFDKIP
ncbi:MAG: glycosyltransferase family 39 protein [Elusimicrobia bacterium]|nr:glycosyltransferase family 39 protein [Elusimicrobiota bacterium]